jgi:two-component system response regulator CpxR
MIESRQLTELSSSAAERSILLVDDDVDLCNLMIEYFKRHGYDLECEHNGREGLARALAGKHLLVILDVMLPVLNGFEVLRQLRKRSSVAVIMLTARTLEQDRVTGLDSGADDYLPKPFGPDELMARIRAVLRRFGYLQRHPLAIATFADIKVDLRTREVRRAGTLIELTSIEFDIFELLVHSAGRIVTRDEIASALYQREATPYERSLDVHVSHLRKKLEHGTQLIHTVRGVGYRLARDDWPNQ